MTAFASLIVGVALLLLLLAVGTKGWLSSQGPAEPEVETDATSKACPAEFVVKIFSPDDWVYIKTLESAGIERLYRRERRSVALAWVHQTAGSVRGIFRAHAAAARQSKNLEPATELKIFLQFVVLLMACGAIRMGIYAAGPLWMGGLARYAQRLLQQISETEHRLHLQVDSVR